MNVRRVLKRLGLRSNFLPGGKRILAALALMLLAGGAQAHEWYSGLKSPRSGVSCCDETDCDIANPCTLTNGAMGIVVRDQCRPIPWHNVLAMPSPDGMSHACMMPSDLEPRCVILGGGV